MVARNFASEIGVNVKKIQLEAVLKAVTRINVRIAHILLKNEGYRAA